MKKERVISAISHNNTEYVPHYIDLTVSLADKVSGHLRIQQDELLDWFDNHIESILYRKGQYLEGEIYEDPFGVKWDRSGADKDIGIIQDYLIKEPNMNSYRIPEPNLDYVDETTTKLIEANKDSFKFGKLGFLLFERCLRDSHLQQSL